MSSSSTPGGGAGNQETGQRGASGTLGTLSGFWIVHLSGGSQHTRLASPHRFQTAPRSRVLDKNHLRHTNRPPQIFPLHFTLGDVCVSHNTTPRQFGADFPTDESLYASWPECLQQANLKGYCEHAAPCSHTYLLDRCNTREGDSKPRQYCNDVPRTL
jgi:hypothetical protein